MNSSFFINDMKYEGYGYDGFGGFGGVCTHPSDRRLHDRFASCGPCRSEDARTVGLCGTRCRRMYGTGPVRPEREGVSAQLGFMVGMGDVG